MNPYDADAALEAIRPRLEAARARRRRAVGASTGALLLAVSSVAAAAVMSPSDTSTVVAVSPNEVVVSTSTSMPDSLGVDVTRQGEGAGAGQAPAPAPFTGATSPTTEAPKPPAPVADAPKPPAPVEAPKPPTTDAPKPPTTSTTPPTQQHTFTYPGTGSVTVSQTGDKLTFVSATAEPGWSKHLAYDQHDLIGVEFKKDNIQRWLKVKVIDGVVHASQHEQINCVVPPGTTTHEAPEGAGSIDVTVDDNGKLSLSATAAAEGWTPETIETSHTVVKVGFHHTDGQFVWVRVKAHGCELKTETG